MKKLLIIFLTFVFTVTGCLEINNILQKTMLVFNKDYKSKYNFVLDAGHGGSDAGTIAADGTLEKDINLGVVLDLYDFLMISGINTFTIRNGDYEYYPEKVDRSRSDLYNRLDFVNSINNAVLVSIHQNHFEDTSEHGMQVWYTANEKSSKSLADDILDTTKLFIQPDNKRLNKVSDNSYYILYRASVPSVMVECGFMSNAEENNKLKDSQYKKDIAYTILLGINTYITEDS